MPTRRGANLLFEGAQGTLLDVDHGTYPLRDVQQLRGGQCRRRRWRGARHAALCAGHHQGLLHPRGRRAVPHRAGLGTPGTPGYHMATVGAEKGVTTGRSRRCGWFDAALLKRSAQVNGLTGLCITKLDVLDGLPELKLCTGYELDGEPPTSCRWAPKTSPRCKPIYETCRAGANHGGRDRIRASLPLPRACTCSASSRSRRARAPDFDQPRPDHTIMRRHPFLALLLGLSLDPSSSGSAPC
jgi:adenylosuccinate synthase